MAVHKVMFCLYLFIYFRCLWDISDRHSSMCRIGTFLLWHVYLFYQTKVVSLHKKHLLYKKNVLYLLHNFAIKLLYNCENNFRVLHCLFFKGWKNMCGQWFQTPPTAILKSGQQLILWKYVQFVFACACDHIYILQCKWCNSKRQPQKYFNQIS